MNSVNHLEAYFWATHAGAELDLLIFFKGKRIGIEIKYTENPQNTKSMNIALNDLSLDQLYIIYPGAESYPITDRITAIPLPDIVTLLSKSK